VRRVLFPVLFGVPLASGCPKPPADDGQVSEPPANGQAGQTARLPTEYRFPLGADLRTLDPGHITDSVSDAVARRIFSTLVKFDPDGNIINDLAESYTIEHTEEGVIYRFQLRENARFHNGEPLTAHDVAYSLKRLLSPEERCERANLLNYVKGAQQYRDGESTEVPGIQAVSDFTIRIVLNQPYAPFIHVLCMTSCAILPHGEVERDPKGFGDNPVGSGPYVFESWAKDDRVVLRANRDYFGETPKIETLIFRIVKDEKTRFENFKAGALEHCDIPPSQIEEVRNTPRLNALVQGRPAMDMYCYGFNCEEPPFKDNTALRQALNYAVDKQNIAENIWGGLVTEQKTYVPEGMFYFWDDCPGYPYNPEKAKELLDNAGYPGGEGLPELVLNIDTQATNKLVAQAVMEDLRNIGVTVRIEVAEWGPFLTKVEEGESLFFQNTWVADYPDPDNWLYQLLHSDMFGAEGNLARWRNSEFDKLVSDAQVEEEAAVRAELYAKAEQIAHDEAPWLLLLWKNSSTLVQPYVKGLTISRMDRTPQLNNAPLESVYYEAD